MITADMIDFQAPPDADHNWVETMVLPFVIPEEGISALVYVCIRPGLGVMANQVMINGALSDNRMDLLHYCDHQHMPAPASLRRFSSEIGLSVHFHNAPRDIRLDYQAPDGTEFHIEFQGLMDPFDTHDPNHSPQARKVEDMHADINVGEKHRAGHFDMTGRITGTLKVRGRSFTVDCIERMDHSWGPRNPTTIKNMYIVSATFDENLFYHMICPWKPDAPRAQRFSLTHGYVCENGEVLGLTDHLRMDVQHLGLVACGLQMEVKDIRGKTHELSASLNVGAPWIPYSSAISYLGLMNFYRAGRPGYGIIMANYSLPWLLERQARFHDALCPKVMA
ncbi:hypothetical protein [Paracoccus sp. FO-3]|uniref:DUF7065 domain-containing protein n=1 Tax=Paracoccus sp. FO-3 TaxID=1335059 RepID=UPI001128F290|nr:hypothetical protein [Paracoccus sp. FO-3]